MKRRKIAIGTVRDGASWRAVVFGHPQGPGRCGTDLVTSVWAGLPTGLTTFARQHSLDGPTAIAFVDGLLNPLGEYKSLDGRGARRPAAPYASDRNTRPSIFRLKNHGNPPHTQTV